MTKCERVTFETRHTDTEEMSERPINARETNQFAALGHLRTYLSISYVLAVLVPFCVPISMYYYCKAKYISQFPTSNGGGMPVVTMLALCFLLFVATLCLYIPGVVGAFAVLFYFQYVHSF